MEGSSTLAAAGPSELTPRVREEIRASELTTERRVITEAERPYRIVHANRAWLEVTGFRLNAVVGNTCKILQGPETCHHTLKVRASQFGRNSAAGWRLRAARPPLAGYNATRLCNLTRPRPFPPRR